MLKKFTLSAVATVLLTGCAASIPPVQVTRFHTNPQLVSGSAMIEPLGSSDSQGLEFRAYAAAVGRELTILGVTESRGTGTPYVVTVGVSRTTREELAAGSPVTVGIGGGSFGRRSGVSLGTSFGLGRNRPREIIITQMSVQIRRRADNLVLWEGRAETEASSRAPASQPSLAADKLATALFKGFPGESGRTVRVP